jgi:hypothetical protein
MGRAYWLQRPQDPQYDPSEARQYREIEQKQGKHPQSILRRLLAHLGLVQFDTVHCTLPKCRALLDQRLGLVGGDEIHRIAPIIARSGAKPSLRTCGKDGTGKRCSPLPFDRA